MPLEPHEAFAWLEDHVNLESLGSPATGRLNAPSLDRIRALVDLMGEPQRLYPVIHVTGTNGKTSTVRMIAALIAAHGLSVGAITSPSLQKTNERISRNGEPIDDHSFAEILSSLSDLESLLPADQPRLSWFEIVTAAAYRWFADVAVDVAVVEVGMGGQWDATNVADGIVAVVTNVAMDHADYLGGTLESIAREKSGIVKPGSTLILGETSEELAPIFRAAGANEVWERGVEFDCLSNQVAFGGRMLTLQTPGALYSEVLMALHGNHQGDNAACALAAVEAFFGAPIDEKAVEEGFATVTSPGRLEVLGRRPLVVLDGAHNPAGAEALGLSVDEAFSVPGRRVIVAGFMRGRDPVEMLAPIVAGQDDTLVVAVPPPNPRAMDPAEVAAAAESLGAEAIVAVDVETALQEAFAEATEDDLLLVTGSLYLVGAARSLMAPG